MPSARSILMAVTGLRIDGGVASVSRCVARALDEELAAGRLERVDRLLLSDRPGTPGPRRGRQWRAGDRQLVFAARLWQVLVTRRPDLVFFDHLGLGRPLHVPLPGLRPPRYVVFAHGTELAIADQPARRRVLENAWRVLTNSAFTARSVRALLGDSADHVVPVPLCIDPERVEGWRADEVPASAREPAVLIVGRMWSEERGKGHDALIEAWPTVVRAHPEAELWIAGGGDDVERLRSKAADLGVAQRTRFLGRVPDEELEGLYRRASLFAMPSRQEGFGLVYAEAMWHGLPCVASTADAAGEVVADGETGLLVPYGIAEPLAGALVRLLADEALRTRMAAAARRRARERFGYARFREDLLGALELGPPR